MNNTISNIVDWVSNKFSNWKDTPDPSYTYITILPKLSEINKESTPAWNVSIVYRHPHREDTYTICRACPQTTISKLTATLDGVYMAMDSMSLFGNPTKVIVLTVPNDDVREALINGATSSNISYLADKINTVRETLLAYPGTILLTKNVPFKEDLHKAQVMLAGA